MMSPSPRASAAVITPDDEIDIRPLLWLSQLVVVVTSRAVPSENSAVAVSCRVCPGATESGPAIVSLVTVTVTGAGGGTPPGAGGGAGSPGAGLGLAGPRQAVPTISAEMSTTDRGVPGRLPGETPRFNRPDTPGAPNRRCKI